MTITHCHIDIMIEC